MTNPFFKKKKNIKINDILLSLNLNKQKKNYIVNDIKELSQQYHIKGIANITGGGLIENITRVLPKHVDVNIDIASIQVPTIFSLLQQYGDVSTDEMFRVFNMGVGMVVITAEKISNPLCYCIGKISGKK